MKKFENLNFNSFQWNIKKITQDFKSYNVLDLHEKINIAIIDSGIDYTHEEFKGKIDHKNSYNFIDNSKNILDNNGHGTMVAGVICADKLINGVYHQSNLIICKITDYSHYKFRLLLRALKYAIDLNVHIINLSMSFPMKKLSEEALSALENIIAEAFKKNIIIVMAAGNKNYILKRNKLNSYQNFLTIGSTDRLGNKSTFSNYGYVKYLAPGGEFKLETLNESILTTYPTYLSDFDALNSNLGLPKGYVLCYGTSLSAAHVTGALGYIISYIYSVTNTKPKVENILKYLDAGIREESKLEEFNYAGEINIYNSLMKILK
ncbi:S8 family peptidase [Rummeliibacillus suwonensis]|uniref:S8 family peptidase n=1 Tax=Rummeliibacillus suwonensis TaxID=1306154 RepID=UPI0028A18695|nr:S8 family serine peptidase [Rummeliibacillus suwonensis]